MHITKQLFFLATLFATTSFYTVSINAAEDKNTNITKVQRRISKTYFSRGGRASLIFILNRLSDAINKNELFYLPLEEDLIEEDLISETKTVILTLSRDDHGNLQATEFDEISPCNFYLKGNISDIIDLLSKASSCAS